MRFRILSVCVALVVGFSMMTTVSFAANNSKVKIITPKAGYTAYAGEKIAVSFNVHNGNKKKGNDLWPWIRIYDEKNGAFSDYFSTRGLVPYRSTIYFNEKVKLPKSYPEKTFRVRVIAAPYKVGGNNPNYGKKKKGWEKGMVQQTVKIKMKVLYWPESMKLTASKGKITIKCSKVKGATAYEFFRSTKAKGKYESIGKSGKPTYVDKKVKAGKTYYYKIKAVRNKHGLIKSDFGPRGKMKAQ